MEKCPASENIEETYNNMLIIILQLAFKKGVMILLVNQNMFFPTPYLYCPPYLTIIFLQTS